MDDPYSEDEFHVWAQAFFAVLLEDRNVLIRALKAGQKAVEEFQDKLVE